MPVHPTQRPAVTRPAHGAVLTLLLAGFLSMHGFFAVSSPAHATAPTVGTHPAAAGHDWSAQDVGVLPLGPAAGHVSTPLPAPSGGGGHAPLDHHDVLMGCVVALVGVTALGLASLLLPRVRSARAGRARPAPAFRPSALAGALPRPSGLPRIAFCVLRV